MKLEGIRYKRIIMAVVALIVVMLALILLINFLPILPGTTSGWLESRTLEAATTTETFTFTPETPDSGAVLSIDAILQAGSLTWAVLDPSGAVFAEGAVAAGETITEALALPPISGAWQVVVETEAATGVYLIQDQQPVP